MKFRGFRSIAVKITILVLVGTALVFSGILAYSYVYSKNMILEEAKGSAINLAKAVANRIEREFRGVEKVPRNLACVLESAHLDEKTLHRVMRRMVEENSEIFGAAIAYEPYAFSVTTRNYAPYFCKKGKTVEYVQLATPEYNYFQQDWYHIPKELKAPVWSEPYFDEGGGNILMATYSFPLFEESDDGAPSRVKAILTADVSLEWLSKFVASMGMGRTGYGFLISGNGQFVTHPRTELIMRESIFSLADELNRPHLREIGREMIRRKTGFVDLGRSLRGEEAFLAWARIPSAGWSFGAVLPKDELFAGVTQLHLINEALGFVGILLLLGVSLLVARSIARPLRRMAGATAQVARGDLDVDLSDIRTRDEVGQLAKSFVDMTEGLKQRDFIRDTFGRYLTREVVTRLLDGKDGLQLGGESREITIVMSDIRGFTALTANMQPEQVITFLNRYLGKMLEIILDYRGTIDEIIGDGILAFFGAPEPLEDHPARAVACALKMQDAMDEINALNEADGLPRIEMGVAVNTGHVVVGNIGSERRTKYGAVGSQVNFTGRMESFTVGGQVLISTSTYERLSRILEIRNVLNVEMKGIAGTVALYDISGIGGSYDVRLKDHDDPLFTLAEKIRARVRRLDQKTVTTGEIPAEITQASLTSAVITLEQGVRQWENLRISLLDGDTDSVKGEVYAKVVSIQQDQGKCKATLRFTSISAEAYKIFRRDD